MKKYKIPRENRDLISYARRKQAGRAFGFLAYCAVFALAYLFYLQGELREPLSPLLMVVFVTAVLISGIFIFRTDKFLTDKSFSGKICSMKVIRSYGRGMNRNAKLSLDFHSYIKILVTDGKGRKRRARVQLFDDGFDGYYSESNEIVAFRGLNYPLSLDSERRGEHICAVCGVRCYDRDRRDGSFVRKDKGDGCPACRRTMIDVEELTK